MTRDLALIGVSLGAGVSVYVLLAVPRWLFTSLNRGCVWQLRDGMFEDRRVGVLPDEPAIDELIGRLEGMILLLPSVNALRIARMTPDDASVEVAKKFWAFLGELRDLPKVEWYINESQRLLLRQYFTGTWGGLLLGMKDRRMFLDAVGRRRWHRLYEMKARGAATQVRQEESQEIGRIVGSTAPWPPPARHRRELIAAS
jgi:hypothetical protein